MAKVPVLEDGVVVARVEYNKKLDFWDGRNYTCGQTGRHLGYTRLKSGKYVLIHGTQWQGEQNSAEVVSAEDLIQAAARTGHLESVLEEYPELRDVGLEDEEENHLEPEVFEGEVTAFGNGAHVIIPREHLGKKVICKIL